MPDKLHYHLIGIGGVGMSAIARILHDRGETVSGSDLHESDITTRLRSIGMRVSIGHAAENVNGADVVVYTAAAQPNNPEILEARRRGLTVLERPAMLGKVMESYKHRIAVSGTHGKTTTTSMIQMVLDRAGIDASVLIGGDAKSMGDNARLGGGEVVLAEACEAFESFLHLYPSIAVITNIDADHMEYYGTIEHIEDSFRQFMKQVDEHGCVIACWDDERTRRVASECGRRIVSYGTEGSPALLATDVDVTGPEATYTLLRDGVEVGRVRLGVPGKHNVLNSLAAAAVGFELGISFDDIGRGLADFLGAERRFDVLFDNGSIMVVDDYAHHPAEIAATLEAARTGYNKRIIAVFQPHLYSRTKLLLDGFASALAAADEVIVCPIYAAREKPMNGVTGEIIVDKMRANGYMNARYAPDKDAVAAELGERVKPGDMVLILGAGDIRTVAEELAQNRC